MRKIFLLKRLIDCSFILTIGKFSLEIPISSLDEYQNVDGFKLDRQKLASVRVLGSGNFGQVCKAIYGPLRAEVAVKSLKSTSITIFHWVQKVSNVFNRSEFIKVSFNPIFLSITAVYVFLSESVKIWWRFSLAFLCKLDHLVWILTLRSR